MLSSATESTSSTYFTTSCQRLQSNILPISLQICFCHLEELLQNTITPTFASELNIEILIQCSLHQHYSRRKNGFISHTAQSVQHFCSHCSSALHQRRPEPIPLNPCTTISRDRGWGINNSTISVEFDNATLPYAKVKKRFMLHT